MEKSLKERLLGINEALISEAHEVIKTKFDVQVIGAPTYVELQPFHRWWGKVKSFIYQLGSAAKPWESFFDIDPDINTLIFTERVLGTLEAIKHEIENDYLCSITQVLKAETLVDLIDQAEHLFKNGYHLAAGVIGRAVLEEHLRNLCERNGCEIDKKKPTINDFNQALYKADFYSKTKMKFVEVLASIGNDAAHNKPELTTDDVSKLLNDLPSFIDQTNV